MIDALISPARLDSPSLVACLSVLLKCPPNSAKLLQAQQGLYPEARRDKHARPLARLQAGHCEEPAAHPGWLRLPVAASVKPGILRLLVRTNWQLSFGGEVSAFQRAAVSLRPNLVVQGKSRGWMT